MALPTTRNILLLVAALSLAQASCLRSLSLALPLRGVRWGGVIHKTFYLIQPGTAGFKSFSFFTFLGGVVINWLGFKTANFTG